MANKVWKGITVKLDGSTGTATDITASINSITLTGEQEALEDTSLNDEERSYAAGLAGATVEMNGWSNSTTDNMFAGLVGNRTSVTKTMKYYNGNKWFQGEILPTSVEISGEAGQLQVWSFSGSADGALANTTS